MPTQPVNDHIASANFTAMMKPCHTLFDGQPKNWPAFENHLLMEAGNPNIRWNSELIHFQLIENATKPFSFLEAFFNIPETMVDALKDDLKRDKLEYLQKTASQLYRLYSLKTTLKNCLTPDLARDIKPSMPPGISN
jgi:hypothetical protein